MPSPISALISSVALMDIFCASSPTVIVSGMATSRTTGAVGISNAWRAGCVRTTDLDFCFLRLRPALSLATCSSSRLRRPRSRRPPRSRPSPRFASGRRVAGAGAGAGAGGDGGVVGAGGVTAGAGSAVSVVAAGSGTGSDAGFSTGGRFFFFSGSRSLRSASSFSRASASALRVSSSSCWRRFASSCKARFAASMRALASPSPDRAATPVSTRDPAPGVYTRRPRVSTVTVFLRPCGDAILSSLTDLRRSVILRGAAGSAPLLLCRRLRCVNNCAFS